MILSDNQQQLRGPNLAQKQQDQDILSTVQTNNAKRLTNTFWNNRVTHQINNSMPVRENNFIISDTPTTMGKNETDEFDDMDS